KNSVISCPQGEDIIDITVGAFGPEADINLFRQQQSKFSDSQQFVGDKAYVGASQTTTPTKKPKGKKLTQEQKQENQQLSRISNFCRAFDSSSKNLPNSGTINLIVAKPNYLQYLKTR
ncbi:MAG: transposase family protein, partial [Waterburya sp.]